MNTNVVIIDRISYRGEKIRENLSRADGFSANCVPWTRSSGPDMDRQECIERIAKAGVIVLHGSEQKWFPIFIEAREPSDDPHEKPILWIYRGSPFGRELTIEQIRNEVEQVYDWDELAKRYAPILPVTEDIDDASEINWVVLLQEHRVQLQTFNYSVALSILCQGFLATHRHAGVDGGADYKRALDMMGWDQLKDTIIVQNLNGRVGEVQSGSWWQEPIGEDEPEIRKKLAMELRTGTLPEASKVAQLVEQIYKPSASVDDVNLVAGAFLEIADELQ